MKKLTKIILIGAAGTMLATGCSRTSSSLKELKKGQTLHVGSYVFKNYIETTEYVGTIRYAVNTEYVLNRSTNSSYSGSVYYNNYYYYWTANNTTTTEELGTCTATTDVTYSYLIYEKDISILVRAKEKTTYKYSYKGGWTEKPRTVNVNLNGYFASVAVLQASSGDLFNQYSALDLSASTMTYVDTSTPSDISYSEELFTSYYYITK